MAIQIQGNEGNIAQVRGTNYRGIAVERVPIDHGSLGQYRLAMATGIIGAALAANGELFQFRWTDATRLAAVYKVSVSGGANVAATAAGLVTLDLTIARSFTGVGSGGATATLTGNNQKVRTSHGTTLLGEARIATTAALGAGTKTLDSHAIGNYSIGIGTGAITTANRLTLFDRVGLLDADGEGQHPIILAQNEGLVVKNGATVWPATMTWNLGITVIWAELTAY